MFQLLNTRAQTNLNCPKGRMTIGYVLDVIHEQHLVYDCTDLEWVPRSTKPSQNH